MVRSYQEFMEQQASAAVALQRNAPLLSPEGRDSFPDDPWFENTTDKAFADAWTLRNVDRYIDQLGLEEVAPGIRSAQLDPRELDEHTARGTEAATLLASYIGDRTGLGTDEVLDRITAETPDRQLRTAAEMLGDPSLEDVLRDEFARQNTGSTGERTNVVAYHVGSPPPERPRHPVPQDVVDAVRSAGIPDDAHVPPTSSTRPPPCNPPTASQPQPRPPALPTPPQPPNEPATNP